MNAKLDDNLYEDEIALFGQSPTIDVLLYRLARNRYFAIKYLKTLPLPGIPTPEDLERITAHLEANPQIMASVKQDCDHSWSNVLDEDNHWPFVRCQKCRCTRTADQLPVAPVPS